MNIKITKFILLPLLILGILFSIFVWYAYQEAITQEKMAPEGIFGSHPGRAPEKIFPNLIVASYNLGYAFGDQNNHGTVLTKDEVGKNLVRIISKQRDFKPDIVFLQEVDFFSKRTHDINQMEYLSAGLELAHGAYAITWNKKYVAWPYWPLHRHFGRIVSGQAVLSRYPIVKHEILRFEKPNDNPFWYNWFYLDRVVQRVVLKVDEKEIEVYNVHLEAFSKASRKEQWKELGRWVQQKRKYPVIVAGDFNLDWNQGEEKQQVEGFLKQTQLTWAEPLGKVPTFPSWEPKETLDYIFYSPPFKLNEAWIQQGLNSSDHLPVWAILRF